MTEKQDEKCEAAVEERSEAFRAPGQPPVEAERHAAEPHVLKTDRRSLLKRTAAGVGGIAFLFALGAGAALVPGDPARAETRIRPPGSVPEDEFLARCLKCDRCRSVCHTDVIGMADWADGLVRLRTPVLDFRLGHCDFCGKCAEVCPTGAIEPFEKETEKVGLAELTDRCIALRTGACRVCYEKCPYDAITLNSQNVPVIDSQICNGCGLCEKVCPANVFQAYRTGRERGIVVRPLKRGAAAAGAEAPASTDETTKRRAS